MKWFLKALINYSGFEGRSQRKEYWYFILFNILFSLMANFLDIYLLESDMPIGLGFFSLFLYVALLMPTLTVTIRRLHDVGKSGWWILVSLVPYIGIFLLLIFLIQDSESGDNDYGVNPKGVKVTPIKIGT